MAALKLLRDDATRFFSTRELEKVAQEEQVQQILSTPEGNVPPMLHKGLKDYLYGQDEQLVMFVERNLATEVAFQFGEQLKKDSPETNRAWRAYQRLLWEGLDKRANDVQVQLSTMQAEQQTIVALVRELHAWGARINALPPEQREQTGQTKLVGSTVQVVRGE